MLKILRNMEKVYAQNRHVALSYIPKASITSINLNTKQPPKQPVPDLNKTAEKYLKSVRPLLTIKEYDNTEKIVHAFIKRGGPGPVLQEKLLEKYNNTENWLADWFMNGIYMEYREPLIINTSPATVSPPMKFKSTRDMHIVSARLIRAVCDYDKMVKSGKIKQEMAKDAPLDMQPYALVLGTHRRPRRKCDELLHTDVSNHIIIICNNNFYRLCLYDGNDVLSEEKLVAALEDIETRSSHPGAPVGILTASHRDVWVEDYEVLIGLGKNKEIIRDIENSLFILCIDKSIPRSAFKTKTNLSVRSVQSLTGFSSSTNSANRWNDKTVQYIVGPDGFVGMLYEHSPCEGVPVAVLHDLVLNSIADKSKAGGACDVKKGDTSNFPKATLLEFDTNNNTIQCAMNRAARCTDKLISNFDIESFNFRRFGTTRIKQLKFSPDSFIQTALQVTYYRLHNKPPAHYESAALRRFRNSRTECIRSTSCESVEFAKAMTESDVPKDKRKELMVTAINAHKKIASEAAMGQGVDRHLFGLRLLAREQGMELPEIFKDIGYTRSTHYTLSTSQVPFKTASYMCYGPVVNDGYGCCYNPRPDDIFFSCATFNDCSETTTMGFAETLQQSLCDMENLAAC